MQKRVMGDPQMKQQSAGRRQRQHALRLVAALVVSIGLLACNATPINVPAADSGPNNYNDAGAADRQEDAELEASDPQRQRVHVESRDVEELLDELAEAPGVAPGQGAYAREVEARGRFCTEGGGLFPGPECRR